MLRKTITINYYPNGSIQFSKPQRGFFKTFFEAAMLVTDPFFLSNNVFYPVRDISSISSTEPQGSVVCVQDLRTGGRWFDPQYSF